MGRQRKIWLNIVTLAMIVSGSMIFFYVMPQALADSTPVLNQNENTMPGYIQSFNHPNAGTSGSQHQPTTTIRVATTGNILISVTVPENLPQTQQALIQNYLNQVALYYQNNSAALVTILQNYANGLTSNLTLQPGNNQQIHYDQAFNIAVQVTLNNQVFNITGRAAPQGEGQLLSLAILSANVQQQTPAHGA